MGNVDYLIIGGSSISGILFIIFGAGKSYRAYLGIFIGFLFSLLINLKLNNIAGADNSLDLVEYVLSQHRGFFSGLSIIAIPLFATLLIANNGINFKTPGSQIVNILLSFILGFILIPFILGLFYIIYDLGLNNSNILLSIIDTLKGSNFWSLLPNYEYIIFLTLFGILFYKFVFYYLVVFAMFLLKNIHELREEEKENRDRSVSSGEDSDNDTVQKYSIDLK